MEEEEESESSSVSAVSDEEPKPKPQQYDVVMSSRDPDALYSGGGIRFLFPSPFILDSHSLLLQFSLLFFFFVHLSVVISARISAFHSQFECCVFFFFAYFFCLINFHFLLELEFCWPWNSKFGSFIVCFLSKRIFGIIDASIRNSMPS